MEGRIKDYGDTLKGGLVSAVGVSNGATAAAEETASTTDDGEWCTDSDDGEALVSSSSSTPSYSLTHLIATKRMESIQPLLNSLPPSSTTHFSILQHRAYQLQEQLSLLRSVHNSDPLWKEWFNSMERLGDELTAKLKGGQYPKDADGLLERFRKLKGRHDELVEEFEGLVKKGQGLGREVEGCWREKVDEKTAAAARAADLSSLADEASMWIDEWEKGMKQREEAAHQIMEELSAIKQQMMDCLDERVNTVSFDLSDVSSTAGGGRVIKWRDRGYEPFLGCL